MLVLWGGLARVARALSAQTPAEAERAAALHRTFGNVHEAVGAFFDNLDELLEEQRAKEASRLGTTHMQEMMGKQRSNALEAFSPEKHVDELLSRWRAASSTESRWMSALNFSSKRRRSTT